MQADHINYLTRFAADTQDKIKVIYDIGACMGEWSALARQLWPRALIFAFEANERMIVKLNDTRKINDYHIAVLSNMERKRVQWYENLNSPTGDSYYRESGTGFYPPDAYRWRTTQTLDGAVSRRRFPPADLVKIDVQGSELDIINGGLTTLAHASDIIVELQHDQYNDGAETVDVSLPTIERLLNMQCVSRLFCNNGPDGDYHFQRKHESSLGCRV